MEQFLPWFDFITTDRVMAFAALLAAVGTIFIGCGANKISKAQFKLAQEERNSREALLPQNERQRLMNDNYTKMADAIAEVLKEGHVTEKSIELFWTARDEARLYLPEEIADYTEKMRDIAWKSHLIYIGPLYSKQEDVRLPEGNERSQKAKEHSDLIETLCKERHNLHQHYRRFLVPYKIKSTSSQKV